MTKELTVKSLFANKSVQERFEKLLGDKSQGFITSVLQVVNSNQRLSRADPNTVLTAAATAAVLDLPILPDLGLAYIVPYEISEKSPDGKWSKRVVAQFQMGYKGFVQLALRTNTYRKINAIPIYQNQFKLWNALTEDLIGDFSLEGEGEIVGYAAHFETLGGFQKTAYWTFQKTQGHAERFSQSWTSKKSLWHDDYGKHAMGVKTVLKFILSKYGILSVEMKTAIQADQAVQTVEGEYRYVDNPKANSIDLDRTDYDKERARILDHINAAETVEILHQVHHLTAEYDLIDDFDARFLVLTAGNDTSNEEE